MSTEAEQILPEIPSPPEELAITASIAARLEGDMVKVANQDNTLLFQFSRHACPFDRQAISFLVQIYSLGYNKGRVIGMEVAKARLRDMLGAEL
jgi:hypothetical protein